MVVFGMKTTKLTIEEIDDQLKQLRRWFSRYKKQSHLYTRKWNDNLRIEKNLLMKRNQLIMRNLP